jgi:23S rRNA (cytidine1920-2'-O)/16S rRNA (cytidine1409-2'-O)-methyltransferase
MNKSRLDLKMVHLGLAETRSQAANLIKLGYVTVNRQEIKKPGELISENSKIKLNNSDNYVSRAGLKLAAANNKFKINFNKRVVLDAGSSTGGFTDYALRNNARKIYAIEVGTAQMHPKIAADPAVELHEKTDIRDFSPPEAPDILLADLSFISLRKILPHLAEISGPDTQLVVLLKPQFEAGREQINRGVIKNDKIRRQILKDFESWTKNLFNIVDKVDSEVPGEKGNLERFYYLKKIK